MFLKLRAWWMEKKNRWRKTCPDCQSHNVIAERRPLSCKVNQCGEFVSHRYEETMGCGDCGLVFWKRTKTYRHLQELRMLGVRD